MYLIERLRLVITYLCLLLAVLVLTLSTARAQGTMPVKAPAPSISCPNVGCNGGYLGVNIGTLGSSADISANGVNSSVLTAGGLIGVDAGWNYWGVMNNASWFIGGNLKLDYDMTGTNGGSPGLFSAQTVVAGGVLQNVFVGQAGSGQGPTQIGPFTALYPFAEAGIAEKGFASTYKTGWTSGGGFWVPLGGRWMAKAEYLYTNWNATVSQTTTVNNDQRLFLGVDYHF